MAMNNKEDTAAQDGGGSGAGGDRDGIPDGSAVLLSLGILILAVASGLLVPHWDQIKIQVPTNGFDRFVAFYVVAQLIERLTEFITWGFDRVKGKGKLPDLSDRKKPNRIAVIHSTAILLAVIAAAASGLHFLDAVGASVPGWLDNVATGLLISGGTKPLHDFISYLQQKKDQTTPS